MDVNAAGLLFMAAAEGDRLSLTLTHSLTHSLPYSHIHPLSLCVCVCVWYLVCPYAVWLVTIKAMNCLLEYECVCVCVRRVFLLCMFVSTQQGLCLALCCLADNPKRSEVRG